MRAVITGVDGFVGGHLAEYLATNTDYKVYGCGLAPALPSFSADIVQYIQLDLRQPDLVKSWLSDIKPDRIYHLAGQAFVPASWDDPWYTLESNIRPQINIMDTLREVQPDARVLTVSSIEQYGQVLEDELPIDEGQPLRPNTPYSISKIAQDMMGQVYAAQYDLHVVAARPLNHIGPRQNSRFVASAFASQVAAIEAGLRDSTMHVGDLSSKRDFTDVRDMVRCYYLLLEHGVAGEGYNIGSGTLRSIQSLLDILLENAKCDISVALDPARLRKSDKIPIETSIEKLQAVTNWSPEIPFEKTVSDILNYEREQVKSG